MSSADQPAAGSHVPGSAKRPNIILVLVDDMGYSDIGCYGSEIQTPNLDRLGAGGIRFTQMYNTARCCPTRASILTGLYPHQAGVGHMVRNLGVAAYQGYLRSDCVTIAEALASGGYGTYMSGKWHVGGVYARSKPDDWQVGDPARPLPPDRGFEEWYGTPAGAGSYFNPKPLLHNHTLIEPEGDDYYYTDAVSDNAVRMIEAGARRPEPFFLYVAYTAPHWPLHALPADVEKYRSMYTKGWGMLRAERHERLKALGILESKWPISSPDERVAAWADAPHKEWEATRMAVYAAQIDRMDQGIGRIMAKLRELAIEDDTLVIFLSDNGGCAELLREEGQKAWEWPTTRAGRPVRFGNRPDIMPGGPDTYQSYERPWANASNSPFRLYKSWVHEGGISTPLVACWPAVIPAGGMTHAACHVIDMMATCLDAAGATYPETHDGRATTPLEGESLVPLFRGEACSGERVIFFEHEGNRAVRRGPWKLVSQHPHRWELYNMDHDRTELEDLAEKNSPMAKRLEALYGAWAERCGVLPWQEVRALMKR